MKKPARIQLDQNARTRRTQWKQVIQFVFSACQIQKKICECEGGSLQKESKTK